MPVLPGNPLPAYFVGKAFIIDILTRWCDISLHLSPYRLWIMAVVPPARNDMPMQMRHYIAETGKVNLVGLIANAQGSLYGKHHIHQRALLVCG